MTKFWLVFAQLCILSVSLHSKIINVNYPTSISITWFQIKIVKFYSNFMLIITFIITNLFAY